MSFIILLCFGDLMTSFRDAAELNQNQLDELEGKLEKMLKTCNAMINSGKELIQNQR